MRSLSFMRKKEKYIRKLVEPGIPYFGEGAGAAIASTVGLFVAGPVGAVVGATGGKIVTELFSRVGKKSKKNI